MNAYSLVDKINGHALIDTVNKDTAVYMRTPIGLRKVSDVTVEQLPLTIGQRVLNKKPTKILVIR